MAEIAHRGTVIDSVVHLMGSFLRDRGHGFLRAKTNPLPDNLDPARGPDVLVFEPTSNARSDENASPRLRLVVEVLAPTDRFTLILKRVLQYLKHGIPLVWIVEPVSRSVGVYLLPWNPMVLDENDELTGNGVFPDLKIAVSKLFAMPGQG